MELQIKNKEGELLLNFNSETDDRTVIKSYAEKTFKTLSIHMKDSSERTCEDGIDADGLLDNDIDYVEITLK